MKPVCVRLAAAEMPTSAGCTCLLAVHCVQWLIRTRSIAIKLSLRFHHHHPISCVYVSYQQTPICKHMCFG